MPARIVLAHDDADFLKRAAAARRKKSDLTVRGAMEHQEYTDGIGEFMPAPIDIPELVDRVSTILAGLKGK